MGAVLLRVEDELDLIGDILFLDLRTNLRRLPGRDLAVHDRARDPETLLAATLGATEESGSVEQSPEHIGDFLLHDARAVVLNDDEEFVLVGLADLDEHVGKYVRIGGGVQRIVNSLLDRGEERLRRRIVAEDLLVPLEELGDADLALLLREFFRDGGRGHAITAME